MKKIALIILSLVLLMSAVCCSSNPVEPQEVSVKAVLDFSKVKLMKGDKVYFTAEWQFNGKTVCHEFDFIVEDTGIKTREVPFKPRKVAGSMKVSVIRPFSATKDTSEGYEVAAAYVKVGEYGAGSYTVQVEPVDDYLTFTGTNVTVTPDGWVGEKLEYSADGGDWTEISNQSATPEASVVKFRGKGGTVCSGKKNWTIGGSDVSVSGNIMTVLDWESLSAKIPSEACFADMFEGQDSLTDASGLSLPATTLADSCYSGMFAECSGLKAAPALPAKTLAYDCYSLMFYFCTSLTTAPELPAETLSKRCYQFMFYCCTNLTAAPALPATTLADECYYYMFYCCEKLTTAPALPAEVLVDYCYSGMFSYCKSLSALTIPGGKDSVLPAKELKTFCYYAMFDGCSSLKVSNSREDSQKIFTCPSTFGLQDSVLYMFSSTGGEFQGTPSAGVTYYLY